MIQDVVDTNDRDEEGDDANDNDNGIVTRNEN